MTRITKIELYHFVYPLQKTFYPSWIPGYPQNEVRFDLIRIWIEEGIYGISAIPAIGGERKGLGELITPYLLGEDATDLLNIRQRIREIGYLGLRNSWIEPAFWDIKGKLEGKPVYELLGGKPCQIDLYASTGEVKDPKASAEEALACYEQGFRTIKLRVHDFDLQKDIQQVSETAKVVGEKIQIAVDANQGWRVTAIRQAPLWDLKRAKYFIDACADLNIAWVEEPLPMDEYDQQVELRKYSRIPVAGGELHTSGLPEFRMMIERKCYDIFQPDAIFTGGIQESREIYKLCREKGLLYTPHTWTNGIGFAVNLHLFAASGFWTKMKLEFPHNPPSWTSDQWSGFLIHPFRQQNGKISVSKEPGLGIEIDEKVLKKFGKRTFVTGKKRFVFSSLCTRGLKTSFQLLKEKCHEKNSYSSAQN